MGILGNYLPNWLPEDPNQNAAARQGLLAFGAGLLGGRGDLGGILGDGLMAGTQTYNGALAQQQQAALQKAQQQRWEMENKQTQAALAKPARIGSIFSGGQPPGVTTPAAGSNTPAPMPPRRPPALDSSLDGYTPSVMSLANVPKIGDPPRAAGAASTVEPTTVSAGSPVSLEAFYRQKAHDFWAAGDADMAKEFMGYAENQKRKISKRETLIGKDNKPVSVLTYEDGEEAASAYGALPENQVVDMGGTQQIIDKNLPQDGKQFKKTATPGEVLRAQQDERESLRREKRLRDAAVPTVDGLLPDETIEVMVDQYLAGDTSVMQNLGRGAQGAQNIVRLRNAIAQRTKAEGKTGRDLAAGNADYFGVKAGQRSAGTRIANVEMASYEAESLIPLARDASAAVSRSGLLPFGKGQVMFNEQTNDPAMRQFAAANNALVNVYSRAISPSGVPTVADKEHAREMIATAMDDKSYQAVLNQMQKEITAARQAPQQVRRAFNDAVTGKGDHGPIKDVKDLPKKAAQQTYADPAKEQRYQEWKRSQGK